MNDFDVRKFYTYKGPNNYLDRQAVVFNLFMDPDGHSVDFYKQELLEKIPTLGEDYPTRIVDLFCEVLMWILKMDIDLYVNGYEISRDGEEHVIAIEYLDDQTAEDCVYFVSDWFKSMNAEKGFGFDEKFLILQDEFDKTLFGGPTLYSLIEAGLKRNIPVFYLFEENQFQWGYGKKQIRGRSTTFQIDSIKDTEFTMYKDMVKDFLLMCGFPTPVGQNCYSKEEIVEEAEKLGFSVVVKPVAGHKGQGVVTGIESFDEVKKAFQNIVDAAEEEGIKFEGAIVEQQIYGTDHRLISVNGRFGAALERVPAYVDGNGRDSIEELIRIENDTEVRLDNARSPLCKIKIDDDLKDFLELQDKSLKTIPEESERVFLRRVANISQGGVSINVTDKIHPKNIKLVEDIAKYFQVTCLGIDVLAKDISKPWTEGDFGIIEINAGPGVFMHLAPAIGESVDIPGKIMQEHFPRDGYDRVPIIAGNRLSQNFCNTLYERMKAIKSDIEYGSLTEEGIYFNGEYFFKNVDHFQNVKIILRNPRLDFAVFSHNKDDILDYGMMHQGADMVILEDVQDIEDVIARDLVSDGYLVNIEENEIVVTQNGEEKSRTAIENVEDKDTVLLQAVEPMLDELLRKYD